MISNLSIGEVVSISGRFWVIIERAIGGCDKFRPDLILLDSLLEGYNKKPYYRKNGLEYVDVRKLHSFKGIKLVVNKK